MKTVDVVSNIIENFGISLIGGLVVINWYTMTGGFSEKTNPEVYYFLVFGAIFLIVVAQIFRYAICREQKNKD